MALALERGDHTAAALLEIGYVTLARAVAGWPVQRATRGHLLAGLARVRHGASPEALCRAVGGTRL